jgi:hypothetical protein
VYWPLVLIVPGPVLASPPETVQVTLAAPPLFSVAANCSKAWPVVLLVELQPVQLVSMLAVPRETEKAPPPPPEADPPQPATRTKSGTAAAATRCAGQRRGKPDLSRCEGLTARRPLEREPGICRSVVTAGRSLNLSGAFLANVPAQSQLPNLG